MTTQSNTPCTHEVAPQPRSRLRVRIVLAGFAAVGLAALAWAAFVSPLPRLTYNPSDSVAVGWYRIEPFDPRTASLPRPLSVDSIVLVPLPNRAAMLAAQSRDLGQRMLALEKEIHGLAGQAGDGGSQQRVPLVDDGDRVPLRHVGRDARSGVDHREQHPARGTVGRRARRQHRLSGALNE